jgi:hypothetical protein
MLSLCRRDEQSVPLRLDGFDLLNQESQVDRALGRFELLDAAATDDHRPFLSIGSRDCCSPRAYPIASCYVAIVANVSGAGLRAGGSRALDPITIGVSAVQTRRSGRRQCANNGHSLATGELVKRHFAEIPIDRLLAFKNRSEGQTRRWSLLYREKLSEAESCNYHKDRLVGQNLSID